MGVDFIKMHQMFALIMHTYCLLRVILISNEGISKTHCGGGCADQRDQILNIFHFTSVSKGETVRETMTTT